MRTNPLGIDLIDRYTDEYEAAESRTAAERSINLFCRIRLTSNQFSALVPLVMHIGIDDFKRSAVLKFLNQGKLLKAADAFGHYIYLTDVEGRFIDECLIVQREAEKALFLMPEIVNQSKRKKLI